MKGLPSTSVVGRLFWGLVAAFVTLCAVFGVTLASHGVEYFEWGISTSFGLALGVTLVAYLLGAVLLPVLLWILRRDGSVTNLQFIALAVSIVLATWVLTEVSPIAELRSRVCSSSLSWVVGTLIATALVIVFDLVRGTVVKQATDPDAPRNGRPTP